VSGSEAGVNLPALTVALSQVVVLVVLSPLVIGLMRTVRARLEGRVGGGLGQPFRDVRKLLAKEPIRTKGTSWLSVAGPLVLMASSLVVCALMPLLGTVTFDRMPDDLFVVVSVLLAVYALSIPVGSSVLSRIVAARLEDPTSVFSPVSLLALLALAIAVVAETGRLPVDNPATHLELTMVHEAMVLESSGRDLAWLELGSWLRLGALLGLLATLLAPWGVVTEVSAPGLLLAALALSVKLTVTATLLATVEVFVAKVRLFRVPELLAGSFVLAFLAVTASYLVAPG
jgi:formate hydrogenlyase subunit 4